MEENKFLRLQDQVGEAIMGLHDAIKNICESLTDEEIRELANHFYTEAKPTDTHNFPMPIYHEIAEMVEAEVNYRRAFKRAKESGEKFYCVYCGGACQPDHHPCQGHE